MKLFIPIFIVLLFPLSGKACLGASQYKIFPIGTKGKSIYSIDYKLVRTENYNIKSRFKLDVPENEKEEWEAIWILYGFIVEYDSDQKKLKETAIDTTYQIGFKYEDSLATSYSRIFKIAKEKYPNLDYFKPDYISFCDFQMNCEKVSVAYDSINETDLIIYKNKKYPVPYFKDSALQDPSVNPYIFGRIDYMAINSVRIYKNKSKELAVIHLTSGDHMNMYTTDKSLIGKTNEDEIPYQLCKEHKPDFKFNQLENGSYAEPILHHGHGLDLFIVK
jgi:hypothetical protein